MGSPADGRHHVNIKSLKMLISVSEMLTSIKTQQPVHEEYFLSPLPRRSCSPSTAGVFFAVELELAELCGGESFVCLPR